MIHSASRSDLMMISEQDVEMALHDLLEVEEDMPKIFDEMLADDSNVDQILDIMHELNRIYAIEQRPIPYYKVARVVGKRVKSYEIPTMIEALVAQQLLKEQEPKVKIPGALPRAFIPIEQENKHERLH